MRELPSLIAAIAVSLAGGAHARGTRAQAVPQPALLAQVGAIPTFTDPTALVTWLIEHSGQRGFNYANDADTANVFSPGLRAAFARSRKVNEPPCGADGDIILDTQEGGAAQNVRLALHEAAPDRATVAASQPGVRPRTV